MNLNELPDKELSLALGEILQPEKNGHEYGKFMYVHKKCLKCKRDLFNDRGRATKDAKEPCPIPDPIPLDDWNVAGKWWKWTIDTYGCEDFEQALAKLDARTRRYPYDPKDPEKLDAAISNIMLEADPKNFLMIAAICKEDNV